MKAPAIMPDGSPVWLPKVERLLIGGCLYADQQDVQMVAGTVLPSDFIDETLGMVLEVMPYLPCPDAFSVAQALLDSGNYEAVGGEPRLVELMAPSGLLTYSAPVYLEAFAEMVHANGERRRRLAALQVEAQAIHAGGARNVTPIYQRPEYAAVGF